MNLLKEHGLCKNCKIPIIIKDKEWQLTRPYCSLKCKMQYRLSLFKEAMA